MITIYSDAPDTAPQPTVALARSLWPHTLNTAPYAWATANTAVGAASAVTDGGIPATNYKIVSRPAVGSTLLAQSGSLTLLEAEARSCLLFVKTNIAGLRLSWRTQGDIRVLTSSYDTEGSGEWETITGELNTATSTPITGMQLRVSSAANATIPDDAYITVSQSLIVPESTLREPLHATQWPITPESEGTPRQAVFAGAANNSVCELMIVRPAPPKVLRPELVLGWESSRETGTVVHQVPGSGRTVVTRKPSQLRTGRLRLLLITEADALHAEAMLAAPATFTLVHDGRDSLAMRFVVAGLVTLALDEVTRKRWTLTAEFQEVN